MTQSGDSWRWDSNGKRGIVHCRRGGLCCWAFRVEYRNGMGFKRWARKQGVKEFSSVTGIWRVFTKDRRWEEEAREDPLLKPDDDDWLWSSSTINLPVVSHSQHQWDRPARGWVLLWKSRRRIKCKFDPQWSSVQSVIVGVSDRMCSPWISVGLSLSRIVVWVLDGYKVQCKTTGSGWRQNL